MAEKIKKADAELILIESLARGDSHVEAGRKAGVSARTVARRLESDEFKQQIDDFRHAVLSEAAGRLCAASGRAVDTLNKLLTSKSDSIKLSAARSILESAVKVVELVRIEGRLVEIERMLNVKDKQLTGFRGRLSG
jgi:hypothetical protein